MTLQFIDGFDVGDVATKWLTVLTLGDGSSSTTPFGEGLSLIFGAPNYSSKALRAIPTPNATVIVGVNFRWNSDATFQSTFGGIVGLFALYSDGGATEHLRMSLDSNGTLHLKLNGVSIADGPTGQIIPGIWYYIELKATIADSGGVGIVRVNEAEIINFSGDTRNGGTSPNVDMLALHLVGFGDACPPMLYDDLYVADTLGTVNNDFLGMGRVQTLLPNGAGASTALTPVGSVNNWDNVNDVPWSSTDYNYSAAAGDRDTYTLDNLLSSTAAVAGVQAVLIAHSDDATSHVKAALRSGGTVYYDASVALDGTPSDVSIVMREHDPATAAAWTVSGVNALEAGMEVT